MELMHVCGKPVCAINSLYTGVVETRGLEGGEKKQSILLLSYPILPGQLRRVRMESVVAPSPRETSCSVGDVARGRLRPPYMNCLVVYRALHGL